MPVNGSAMGKRHNRPTRSQQSFAIALAGLVSLAVAVAIGRLAFTPLLPMMLHDGVIDLPGASRLATAKYIDYWLCAMACALQPWVLSRWPALRPVVHIQAMRLGLVLTVVLTLGMAMHWPGVWPQWRILPGIASALVFVCASGWCLAWLPALAAPQLGGAIFVGSGLGIAVTGLAATGMVAGGLSAATGWLVMAELALVPALAYGLAGFGYIVTATFLPVIARQALPQLIWLDLFWSLFGVGALLAIRIPPHWDRRHLLIACYALQAAGILLGVWLPSSAGFALGSLMIGLPIWQKIQPQNTPTGHFSIGLVLLALQRPRLDIWQEISDETMTCLA